MRGDGVPPHGCRAAAGRTFDIDRGAAPCPGPVRDLVLKAVAYHDSVASR
ncbi:MAG TPA: hypothetical protein VH394_30455 [Thermoanaerobaculia bacterium]|nr:hypothetical protein [Thermoanaerobaculia bacterium]